MKRNGKNLVSTLLALALAGAVCLTPALAVQNEPEADHESAVPINAPAIMPEKESFVGPGGSSVRVHSAAMSKTALFQGTIGIWEGDGKRLAVYRVNEAGENEAQVVLGVTEATRILSARTGEPIAFSDIREGESAYVYTNAFMTLSLPPQAGAQLILVDIPADYAVPSFVEVDTVRTLEDGTVVLGTDAVMNIKLLEETEVFPYLTKNLVTREMITPGDQLLVWHGPVAESYPSQTVAEKVMVFPYGYQGYLSLDGETLKYNGAALSFTAGAALKVEGESLLLPLRSVAEQMGLAVDWDAKTNSVSVSQDGALRYIFVIGSETVAVDGEDRYLSRPATVENGVSFMELDDFLSLHQLKMETLY